MVDYILLPSNNAEVPSFLLAQVPALRQSSAFARLSETSRCLPGVVCATFARYIAELAANVHEREHLSSVMQVVERLATSNESEIQNLVVTEILENMEDNVLRTLAPLMGTNCKALYERYVL